MNYYSEEEIRRILEPIMDFYVLDHSINKMAPVIIPTSSDRERIRMELWKDAYMHFIKTHTNNLASEYADIATISFDKQFPKS